MATNEERRFEVYTRTLWDAAWQLRNDIEPISCSQAISPGIGQAKFRLRLGAGKNPDGTDLLDAAAATSYQRTYIKIEEVDADVVWVGWIPREEFELLGKSGATKSADHILHAQTFDTFLDSAINGGWVEDAAEPDGIRKISSLPIFNQRSEAGMSLIGNCSELRCGPDGDASFVFSDAGYPWRYYHILDYIFVRCQPVGGPRFFYSRKSPVAILDVLYNIETVVDLNGDTFRSALNKLIPRSRGLYWTLFYDKTTNSIEVYVDSKLDTEMAVGSVTIPANSRQFTVNLWDDLADEQVKIVQSAQNHYDKVIVRGQKIKTCCTVSLSHGDFIKAWSPANEALYLAGAKNSAGYSGFTDEEKRRVNDEFRASDQFDRTFSHFKIPAGWNWKVKDAQGFDVDVHVTLDDAGEDATTYAKGWNFDKALLPQLPLEIGKDYSVAGHPDDNPADSQPEFRKCFVIAQNNKNRFVYLDKLPYFPAHIRTLTREMALEVKFNPQYLLAKNHLSGLEPGSFNVDDIDDYGYDYEELIATVCLETDNYVQVVWDQSAGVENPRTLIVEIPDAELWAIAKDTVVGIKDDGSLLRYIGDKFLRNDTTRLKDILAAVSAQVSKSRNQVEITINDTKCPWREGDMLNDVTIATSPLPSVAGTVVTSYSIDFVTHRTTVRTDFAELDYQSLFSQDDTSSIPTIRAASRELTRQKKEIQKIKAQSGTAILRQSPSTSAVSAAGSSTPTPLDNTFFFFKVMKGLSYDVYADGSDGLEGTVALGQSCYQFRAYDANYHNFPDGGTGSQLTDPTRINYAQGDLVIPAGKGQTDDGAILYECMASESKDDAGNTIYAVDVDPANYDPNSYDPPHNTYGTIDGTSTGIDNGKFILWKVAASDFDLRIQGIQRDDSADDGFPLEHDYRAFVPWFQENSVILARKDANNNFWLVTQLMQVAVAENGAYNHRVKSIKWSEEENRLQACIGDTRRAYYTEEEV